MLDALEVLPCQGVQGAMGLWDRTWIWRMSAIWQQDELTSSTHLQMSFAEYLEALARLAVLVRARKWFAEASAKEQEQLEYGLGAPPASSIFFLDSGIQNCAVFAGHVDAFLASPQCRQAIPSGPA